MHLPTLGPSLQHHADCLRSSKVKAKRPKKVDSDDEGQDAE